MNTRDAKDRVALQAGLRTLSAILAWNGPGTDSIDASSSAMLSLLELCGFIDIDLELSISMLEIQREDSLSIYSIDSVEEVLLHSCYDMAQKLGNNVFNIQKPAARLALALIAGARLLKRPHPIHRCYDIISLKEVTNTVTSRSSMETSGKI